MKDQAGMQPEEAMKKTMQEVSVIIPNFNGKHYLEICLEALASQTVGWFSVYVVDNGSTDGSVEWLKAKHPLVQVIALEKNFGFCRAVNEGIKASKTPYVILLNNDTKVHPDFIEEMIAGIRRHKNCFSGQAKMIQYHDRSRIDDAGNLYNALGWAFARGKGVDVQKYSREEKIFTCCAGAAIYRRKLLLEMGGFDEEHFAYLEDMDVGYRARIWGYENWYFPNAVVYHVGSGTTGSQYNQFKTRYSSRNNVYLVYKNMPFGQIVLNFPFLAVGFTVKFLFFLRKGLGREYLAGIKNGLQLCRKEKKVKFESKNIINYLKIQRELWANIGKRLK